MMHTEFALVFFLFDIVCIHWNVWVGTFIATFFDITSEKY